ncbi:MAG: efflux RND transporter periplasmic adaptor subunit [Polaromonas sp.]|jgi:membrane fusion protein (multidrug efflux system)|nr:efflux RND transporter periplasmic adaptor subunit [Polaromonas sp.]
MASKVIYPLIAAVGIATLGAGAWWYQNQPAKAPVEGQSAGAAPAPQGAASAAGAGGGGGKPTVEVAQVEQMKLVDESQTVGSLRSRQGVVLRPEVSGRITQLNFRDGDRVKKGQLLVQFDDQLPTAQVQQAQAELNIAMANNTRNAELVAQNFISRRTLDESAAAQQVAEAKLALARATAARLKIIAPFDGLAGIRLVNVGDYLKDGADIVNVEDIDAIFVDYRLPERFQTKIRRGQTSVIELDALPGRNFTATVLAIDPLIDANGRSVGVRACIDNRRLQLRPGMFARVNAVFGQRDNARVIPEEAILPQGGKQFVIKLVNGTEPNSRVTQRVEVKIGLRSPGKVEVLEGLEAGDTVVTAGQQRVQRDGTAVRVMDMAAPTPRAGASAPAAAAPEVAVAGKAPAKAGAKPAAAGKAGAALPPLVGPDPCLAGVDEAAPRGGRPAGPARKPVAEGSSAAPSALAPA